MRLLTRPAAVCVLLLTACGTAPGEAQIFAPWAASASGVVFAPRGAARLVGSAGQMAFCLDRPGTARVDKVVPHTVAGGVRIDAFGVQSAGRATAPLAAGPVVVEHECPRAGRRATRAELATMVFLQLKVVQLTTVSTVVDGFVLEYTSDGVPLSYTLPWGLTVCVPGDEVTPLCDSAG